MTTALRRIPRVQPAPGPDLPRYVCFPPAGGSVRLLDPLAAACPTGQVWGYQYPGRADRIDARPPDTLTELAAQAAHELADAFDRHTLQRTALVGFSMGALVALEVAQALRARYGTGPAGLVVVGTTAPHRRPALRRLPAQADLTGLLASDTGTEAGADPTTRDEAVAYARELLQADLRLTVEYPGPADPVAPCPVAALCGVDDPRRAGGDATQAWSRWSSGPFAVHLVPGGHLDLLAPGRAEEFWVWLARAAAAGVGPAQGLGGSPLDLR